MGYDQVTILSNRGGDSKYIVQSGAGTFDKMKFGQNETRKSEKDKYENEKSKYGAWGSTFKDQKRFVDMHHC